ncbi:MAG TPA: FCD domain-containing protein [Solirubrobacteraceae bacterium]|nr:FCD domain-containing protein [Solirubrobacteraceae bacterium]
MFNPVRTRRTFEEAAEQIADKVRAGELRVGDKLPAERDLALQMEISRPTLREAVKVLADAGLLEVRRGPGGGMFVATDVVPVDLVRHATELKLSEAAAVLEARRLIEPQVARLAHERATDEDLAPLEHTIAVMHSIVERGYRPEDEDRFLQLDVQFHLALARAAGNPTLETLLRIVFRQLEILRDMAMHAPAVPEWIIDIHARTLAAVRSGEGIDEVMDEHLAQLEDTLQIAS